MLAKILARIILITIFAQSIVSCAFPTSPTPVVGEITLQPDNVEILAGSQVSLVISMENYEVVEYLWVAEPNVGSFSNITNRTTIYTAPNNSGFVTISVTVTVDGKKVDRDIHLTIIEPTPTPTPSPTSTSTPTETLSPTATPTPTQTPPGVLMVADFNTCDNTNNLNGKMGGAYPDPNNPELMETFLEESGRGCIAQIDFNLKNWAAFWIKLGGTDLSQHKTLSFEMKADPQIGVPEEIKIEIKGQGKCTIVYISGLPNTWQKRSVDLSEFSPGPCGDELTSFENVEELTFVFEPDKSGRIGRIYLDNIQFEP